MHTVINFLPTFLKSGHLADRMTAWADSCVPSPSNTEVSARKGESSKEATSV